MAIIVALLLRFPAFGYMHRAYAIGDAADVNTVNSVPISITNTINDLTDDAVHVVNKNKYEFTPTDHQFTNEEIYDLTFSADYSY